MQLRAIFSAAILAASFSTFQAAEGQSIAPATPAEIGVQTPDETTPQSSAAPTDAVAPAPVAAMSVEHVDMVIEGDLVSVRSRVTAEDVREFDLTDVAAALRSEVQTETTVLQYHRFQDGVVMSIDMADGKVRSNLTVLGKLPGFEPREAADAWLDINAVSVMSGTHVSRDEQDRIVLTLDKLLKPQFGLELWVNGVPVDTFGNEPRTIGPVLLIPLQPVIDELGYRLSREAGLIKVRRTQDQAEITLELASGLVSVNNTPRGVTADMQFAEADTLLLPFSAVETLTGTHIRLVPGTNRVEVTLDDRLTSTALPGADVSGEASDTPFTPEALSYEVSDRGPLRAEFTSHWGNYNSRVRVESAGGLQEPAGLQPAWVSADIQSLDGWAATVGDYTGAYRELAGVDQNRIRGASWRTQRPSGAILAIAAGVPLDGVKPVSDRVSVPEFGGFAGGARLISQDQSQEIGVSASVEPDGRTGLVVAGGQKRFEFPENETGLQSAYVSADLGAFSGDNAGADVRVRATAQYAVSDQVGLSGSASYDGEKFTSGAGQNSFAGVFDQRVGARTSVFGSGTWRSIEPWGALNQLALGLRASHTHQGGDIDTNATNTTLHINTRIGETGPSLSASVSKTFASEESGDTDTTNLRVRALQRFDWGSLTAVYSNARQDDGETSQQFVGNLQARSINRTFENGATIAVAPTASLNWNGEDTNVRAGASIYGDLGRALGERLSVKGRLSALSDFDAEAEAGTRFFANLEARYRISRNVELTAIYADNFEGRSDLSIGLRGIVTFNEPRRHSLPDEGKGILTGRVFLDRNRDGVRQEDEPGIGGVRVGVRGTRLSLNANRDGQFTIQNINQGLYVVGIDKRSLPLGYMISETAEPRVTIGDGRRTDVDIPIILSGQVRGAVFVDDNGNGDVDPGERRLEGQWIRLIPEAGGEAITIQSASFGQYGFESIPPGDYQIEVRIAGERVSQAITISDEDPFLVQPIAVPPDALQADTGIDFSAGILGEP